MEDNLRTPIRGRYRALGELSSSPESRVLLAEDLRHGGRLCALKLIRLRGEEAFEAARREFETLRKLRHPGIAESYDFGRIGPGDDPFEGEASSKGEDAAARPGALAYIASVYYRGLTLREAFLRLFHDPERSRAAGGRPREQEARRWRLFLEALARVCEAIEVVHSHGLVHYDIKPENLLLIPVPEDGPPSRFDVKVLDFGLTQEETTPVGTRVRGTVPYIAPEIFENATADRRSDLFSLGVTMAVAITGRFPFPGGTPDGSVAPARAGRRVSLEAGRRPLPPGLAELIDRLLEPDPDRRPGSALEVLERLEEIGGFRLPEPRLHPESSFPAAGWERELVLVRGELSDLKRGEAGKSLIILEGDSGHFPGKLLDEVEAAARFEGIVVASGSSASPRRHPYGPFAEIVRKLSRELDLHAPRFARFRGTLAAFTGLRPEDLGLDGVASPPMADPVGAPPAGPGALPALKLRLELYRFLDLLTEFFLEAASESPLVLCIRDLQLAGRESLDLLRSISRNVALRGARRGEDAGDAIEPPRLLVIGTLRESEGDREGEPELAGALASLSELASEPYVTRVRLSNLGLENLPGWIRARAPRLALDGDLIRRLHERSGGSMWLVDEFIRRILDGREGGTPSAEEEGRRPAPRVAGLASGPEILLRLPWKAEDSAIERMVSLPPRERRLLELLASARGPIPLKDLERAAQAEGEGAGIQEAPPKQGDFGPPESLVDPPPKDLAAVLGSLETLGFIELREGHDGIEASITHASLGEQIHRQMREDARTAAHRSLAEGLQPGLLGEGPGRVPEDIAFHALHGDLGELYFESALLAAGRLEAAQAHEGALQIYEEVLERVGTAFPLSGPHGSGALLASRNGPHSLESIRRLANERLAEIYAGRGQLHKAIEKLTILSTAHETLAASHGLASVYRRMGEVYHQNGELANGVYFLEKSLKLLEAARDAGGSREADQASEEVAAEHLRTLLALARYHLERDGLDEARKALEQVMEQAGDAPRHREAVCRAFLLRSEIEIRLGRHAEGIRWIGRTLEAARGEKDLPLTFEALVALGAVHLSQGDYDRAVQCFEEGLDSARAFESKFDMATCYSSLGTVHHNRANPQKALEYFDRSLELSSQIGDLKGIATGYNNIGIVHRLKDELPQASEAYKRAIDLFSRINDQLGMAAGMNNLSSILEQDGKYAEALDYSFRALEKRKKSRSRTGIAFSYYRIGKILQSMGELDKAISYAEKSLQIRSELGEKMNAAYSRHLLSELYMSQARYADSMDLCRKALEDFESLGNVVGILMVEESRARLTFHLGAVAEARKALEEVLERCRQGEQHHLCGSCLLNLGKVASEQGDPAAAEERFIEAEKLFRAHKRRRELAESLLERCALKLDLGHLEEASDPLEEAYSILEALGVRDLVPLYFLLQSRLETEKPQPDLETARKFLERGFVEARELNLPELRWRFQYRTGLLEGRRGDAKLSRMHFQQAREVLDGILENVPPEFSAGFHRLRERAALLEAAAGSLSAAPPGALPEPESRPAVSPAAPPRAMTGEEVLALHHETLKLHEIAAVLGSEHDLQKLLESIMDAVLEIVAAERGFLILTAAGTETRSITVARNLDRQMIEDPHGKISESVSLEVIRSGKPVLLRNAIEDTRFSGSKSIRDLRLRSLICVPLRFRNQVLGAIYLDNRHRRNAFRPNDLKILQAFADQAAVAVTNARLMEENVKRNAELLEANQEMESLTLKLRRKVHKRNAELALARENLKDRQHQLEDRYRFRNIVGKSPKMHEIFRLLEKISPTRLPVLLEGESGTGKELMARAIHFNSQEREGRFVSENCGALTESLLESELFGHTKGAFTGAIADKKGLFELAHDGTLFLDEVGDMSLGMQQKLLRVLQEGEIRRVGGKDSIQVRVRIISASNRDLRSLVAEGKFREDLFYRLNGIRILIPSLRERKEDIPFLVQHFLEEDAEKTGEPARHFDADAIRALMAYPWPGNVRELRHFVERTLLTAPGSEIGEEDLVFDAPAGTPGSSGRGEGRQTGKWERGEQGAAPPGGDSPLEGSREGWSRLGSLREAREETEREFLVHCLRESGGNVAAAARRSCLSRESLYRLLRKHGLSIRGT